MKKPKIKSIGYGFYCILMIIISVLGFILYNLGNWVLDTWGLLSIDEIIFHLKVPLDGTNSDVVLDGINACVPLAVLVLFLSIFLIIGLRNKHGKCMIALFLVAVIACGSAGRAAYEYSRAMKSHFRKFGNQMSGSGNHLCNYASLLA